MEEKYIKIITENTESCKSAHKRLDTLEKNIDGINNLAVAVKEIAMETKATREDVNDMNSRLKIVEEKPGKNWENLSKTILTRNCNSSSGLFFGKIWNVGGINMEKIKKIAKYTTNVLAIIGALIAGINGVDGITIPHATQMIQVIAVLQGVIGTYLLTNKTLKGSE